MNLADLFPNKPAGVYLDTAAVGLAPEPVAQAVADCYREYGGGVVAGVPERWRTIVATTAAAVRRQFDTEHEVTFAAHTGEAMNTLARAIAWEAGDEVLVLSDDYPSVVLPWSTIPAVSVVRTDPWPGDDRTAALQAALTTATRVVAVTHVHARTGTTIDLRALGAAAHAVGAALVVDGAQGGGVADTDLAEVDAYVVTGYKWLLAGWGIAVLLTAPAFAERLRPTLLGHANVPPSRHLRHGHVNLSGVRALAAACAVRERLGLDWIRRRTAGLTARLHAGGDALGLPRFAPPARTSGIVSFDVGADAEWLGRALGEQGVTVAVRNGALRVSPYFYTSDGEVDRFLDALGALIAQHGRLR